MNDTPYAAMQYPAKRLEIISNSHNSFKKQHSEMRKQKIKKNNNKV